MQVPILSTATLFFLLLVTTAHGFVVRTAPSWSSPSSFLTQQQQPKQHDRRPGWWGVRLQAGAAQPETTTKTKVITKQTTKQKQETKKKNKTGDPESRRKEEFQDAPMYTLYLLEDDGYNAEHVILRMCAIIEDLDENSAGTVFQQAMQEGKAMCGKYPFEVAELYKEQLLRSDPMIFADMEED